jgi:hypothetical protein
MPSLPSNRNIGVVASRAKLVMLVVDPKLLPPKTMVRNVLLVPLTIGLLYTRIVRSAPPKVAQWVISPRMIC